MTLRPASWPWLLRHELRLVWRGIGGARVWVLVVLGGLLYAAFHVAAWALLHFVAAGPLPAPAVVAIGIGTWFAFTLMLSQAIVQAVAVLYDRGDLDLLLSSPVEPWRVFAVRALAIAVSVATLYVLLLAPFANVGPFTGHPGLVAIYPTVAALALLATAVGIALTLALVRWLGARRARVAAQVLGALTGAVVFLVFQVQNLFRDTAFVHRAADAWDTAMHDRWLDAASPLWWPAQALLGKPLPLVAISALGLLAFAWAIRATSRTFLSGVQAAADAAAPAAAARTDADAHAATSPPRFRSGLAWLVLRKEWKLIGRDPQLVANTLLQTLYLLPLVFVGPRSHGLKAMAIPVIVVAAATLASALAWLAVAAEDAPELIAAAPVDAGRVRRLKLLAALLPVWLLVSPAFVLLAGDAMQVAVLASCLLGATLAAGYIQLVAARPGERRNLKRRGKGDVVVTGLEIAAAFGWGATTWCLLAAPRFAAIPLVFALAAPATATLVGHFRRRDG